MKYTLSLLSLLCAVTTAFATPPRDTPEGEQRFRSLYKELVETNTTYSAGSCTAAVEKMAARLEHAGFPRSDLHLFTDPSAPKDGGLVAFYPGRDATKKAILLLAHVDVVEAKREDWTRDPFTLIEENGNFYARGALDDKAQAAIWTDLFIRLRGEHYVPPRPLKLALTCGEEGGGQLNGAQWLTKHGRDLIDAEFALNEGASGELDSSGHKVALEVEAAEKLPVSYQLEATNDGGHSSRPRKDNAIYSLAAALTKVSQYDFPAQFGDANRGYFAAMAKIMAAKGDRTVADAMTAFLKDPNDQKAIATVAAADVSWNAMLRTTCVATMLSGGHAPNALPQRARATVNCRIYPGVSPEAVRQTLEHVIADPKVSVTIPTERGYERIETATTAAPPLGARILKPLEDLTAEFWPGVPVLPMLQAGATDGAFLNAAGIPTYGIEPIFVGGDLGHIHGLNEYVSVTSLMEGREFLYRLVKRYAEAP
jgi:acetylornithine deacetylase/succinyl-diaminopimelate desuccinylase-like protein